VALSERLGALLAATEVVELGGGHQARVFRVVRGIGDVVVAKVVDSALVDRHELETRLAMITALCDLDRRVCRPSAIGRSVVAELADGDGGHGYVVCFEFADGTAPDPSVAADANLMGRELAALHTSMSRLPPTSLPAVTALPAARPGSEPIAGPHQLLHGDFNASNMRRVDDGLKIFDFDDCGYGPRAFDVANAMYMVLFDAVVQATPTMYETFKEAFLSGYIDTAGHAFDAALVDHLIDRRVATLESWLDDLDHAPPGIRTASADWHSTLRAFVDEYHETPPNRLSVRTTLDHRGIWRYDRSREWR
jgi:Ser/Thr protein kinase RdoA (MazF antagonist)